MFRRWRAATTGQAHRRRRRGCSGTRSRAELVRAFEISELPLLDTRVCMAQEDPVSRYTFGDSSIAEVRLRRLAELFAPSSEELLRTVEPPSCKRILDAGCGLGLTTTLLARVFPAASSITGLEASERFAAVAARQDADARVRIDCRDVTAVPLPGAPFDLIYARFLLTHLADPVTALRSWLGAASPCGRLVCEELAALTSGDPLVQRYYEIVAAMQAHYGQRFDIGRVLGALAAEAGWRVERFTTRRLTLDVARLLELHALNVRSWRTDPYIRAHCADDEIENITRRLDDASSGSADAPEVDYVVGQLVACVP